MALIKKLEKLSMTRNKVHGEVSCTYTTFADKDGAKFLQVDTYGSPGRTLKGKKSQSIQFGPEAIKLLKNIISEI